MFLHIWPLYLGVYLLGIVCLITRLMRFKWRGSAIKASASINIRKEPGGTHRGIL